jgi:hypothetical protein
MATSTIHTNGTAAASATDESLDALYAWWPAPQTAQTLPEAPASINLKALIGGFEAQITLRDSSEDRLLDRLHALLGRTDIRPIPKPAPRTGGWQQRQQGR